MSFWDYKLDPPDIWEPPAWAIEESDALEDRNDEINEQLRDYEALVARYEANNDTETANVYIDAVMALEEERYENQARILELNDSTSEIYNSVPEGD